MTDIYFDCWVCGERRIASQMIIRDIYIEFKCTDCNKYKQTVLYPTLGKENNK